MRTSIWLVRHGQTQLNRERRYQGALDSPLTEYGALQAAALAARLRRTPFTEAAVSPSGRARATADALLAGRSVARREDVRWAETRHGRWEGMTYDEVRRSFPDEAVARFADVLDGRPLGGESLAEVNRRVMDAWREILASPPGGRLLIVTHATPIQLALCSLGGLSPALHWRWRVDLASLTVIDVFGTSPIVRLVNETVKLSPASGRS